MVANNLADWQNQFAMLNPHGMTVDVPAAITNRVRHPDYLVFG